MGWDGRFEEAEEGSQAFMHTSVTRSRGQARGGTFCRRERRRRPRHDTLELRGVAGSGRAAERADGLLAAAGGPRMRYAVVPVHPTLPRRCIALDRLDAGLHSLTCEGVKAVCGSGLALP